MSKILPADLPATLGATVEFAEQQFLEAGLAFGHGTANAYDEAAYLVLHTLKLPLDDLDSVWERRLADAERHQLSSVFSQRIETRLPAAYLTHEAWLGGHRFYVDERVIVPRSFIAELLDEELYPWIDEPEKIRSVLDLCTGSGCLAILAALNFPNAHVDAVDLSRDALEVAKKNVADYQLHERVSLIESDMFGSLSGREYDLIITNPPYVTAESMRRLPDEYRHEPQMALASGPDGLDHVRTILHDAGRYLTEGGLLVVEAGFNRDGVEATFPDHAFTWLEVSAGDDIVFMLNRDDLTDQNLTN